MVLKKGRELFGKVFSDIYVNRIAFLVLVCYIVITQIVFGTVCPWRIVTGIPCPACGLTHAGVCVLIGRWRQAWEYHPMIFFWMPMIVWWFGNHYLVKKEEAKKKSMVLFRVFMTVCCLLTVFYYCTNMQA